MGDLRIALVSPGRTSSGGSAFSANLVPALRTSLGEDAVVEAGVPSVGRMDLPDDVRGASHVVFLGSRAMRVPGAKTVFWPLNVAPLERHVARTEASSLRNRLRHVGLVRRLRSSVEAADALVFGSSHARTLYQSHFVAGASKPYAVIRGGTPSGLTSRERQEDLSQPLVLLVSHLYPYKGILQFVEAVSRAVERIDTQVRFRVAGADRDPSYAREVHRRVRDLGLTDRLEIAPADPDEMTQLYSRASVAVFASTCENAGSFALYDGLHAGLPTICSDRSSMPEMVGDAVELVNPYDTDLMAAAIVDLVNDGDRRVELSRAASRWSREAPTWDQRASALIDALQRWS